QLKNEEAAWNLKKLELERMQFESEIKKKVKELEFQKASLKLDKVKKKINVNPILEKYERRINELEILQRQADIENAMEVLQSMVLYSPGNGYFQINYNRRGGQNYKLGDEVYMGVLIASIPDVSAMKVRSCVNETDIRKVENGMKVVIRLDALPDISFEGVINNISRICTEMDEQKVFTTEINILDKDERLKPGMSVSCEYVFYESDEELFVPNECLLSENGKVYLFVKRGSKFRKTEVETGLSNSNHTIIHTKITPGRELMPLSESTDI
ncbi:MAG: efflux RND transporter periplasmic adaptor subunit, partial [bacterium]